MSDYKGYDPCAGGGDGPIRQCRRCNDLYDGENFDKCPYCSAKVYNLRAGDLFEIAELCDKARIRQGKIRAKG